MGHLSWSNYEEIATTSQYRYTPSYLQQDIDPKLWKLLSQVLGEMSRKIIFALHSCGDRTIRLWDVFNSKCLDLQGHSGWVYTVAFSPDGRMLASGNSDRTINLWDASSECLHTLSGHTDWIRSVAFIGNGQILASSSDAQMLQLWNVSNGQCIKTLQDHKILLWSVAISPVSAAVASLRASSKILGYHAS